MADINPAFSIPGISFDSTGTGVPITPPYDPYGALPVPAAGVAGPAMVEPSVAPAAPVAVQGAPIASGVPVTPAPAINPTVAPGAVAGPALSDRPAGFQTMQGATTIPTGPSVNAPPTAGAPPANVNTQQAGGGVGTQLSNSIKAFGDMIQNYNMASAYGKETVAATPPNMRIQPVNPLAGFSAPVLTPAAPA